MDELETELTPEGTTLQPTETAESAITVEMVHALVLELQGQVANLQSIADQATPVEPNAEEVEPAADESALLEDEPAEEAPAENEEEVDALLQAN